jgi:hypothetical protein
VGEREIHIGDRFDFVTTVYQDSCRVVRPNPQVPGSWEMASIETGDPCYLHPLLLESGYWKYVPEEEPSFDSIEYPSRFDREEVV